MKRDVATLSLAWACTLTASTLITACGPLAAVSVGASNAIAPFTVGAFLFGAAVVSLPSSRLFARFGRQRVFALGGCVGVLGGALGVLALETAQEPVLVFAACFLIGVSLGIGQFYRFAASELCDPHERARAVTLVLAGGVVAALAGPEAATHVRRIEPYLSQEFSGAFALVMVANVVNLALVSTVSFAEVRASCSGADSGGLSTERGAEVALDAPLLSDAKAEPRSMREIVSQPQCFVAIGVAALAHTAMTMLMSPLSIAMHNEDYSFRITATTLELHFLAMYAPGLLGSAQLIQRLGPHVASAVGLLLFACSAATLLAGHRLGEFVGGMMLCGVAWNLCFASGTVLLTTSYAPCEATRVQGFNDLVIFGSAACGSLASGYIYAALGWERLVYCVSGVNAAFALFLLASLRLRRDRPAAPASP